MRDFAADLAHGAAIAPRFSLGSSCPARAQRMVQFLRRSPCSRELAQDLFAAAPILPRIEKRLQRNLQGALAETLMSFLLGRRETQA